MVLRLLIQVFVMIILYVLIIKPYLSGWVAVVAGIITYGIAHVVATKILNFGNV